MRAKSLDDSIASLKESGKALLDAIGTWGSPAYLASREALNEPPIEAPQRCKVCGKDSIRVICDSEDCSLEFYSAEYQDWPEDEDSGLGTDEGEDY